MRRSLAVATVAVSCLIGAVVAASPASAHTVSSSSANSSSVHLSKKDEAHFRSIWKTYSVTAADQGRLLAAFRAGKLWDSLNGGTPVSNSTTNKNGKRVTVSRYADGSIAVADVGIVSQAAGRARPMADLRQCTLISQVPDVNSYSCIDHTNVVVADFYYTVYFKLVHGGYDSITSVSKMVASCTAGTCSNEDTRITRAKETASQPAQAEGELTYTAFGGIASRDYALLFDIKNDKYTTSNN